LIVMNIAAGTMAPQAITGRALVFAILLLGGCAQMTGTSAPMAANPMPVVATPMDAVVAFAASARPGAEAMVTLDTGRSARVRLLRAYNAASGRECREVLVGGGIEERSRLVCQSGDQWADARPLLRGGGMQRP
jgi:hypothetical protein